METRHAMCADQRTKASHAGTNLTPGKSKKNKPKTKMTITSKKLDNRSRSYMLESPFYGERVNIITDKGFAMKHCILMIGCNGIQIERREFAKLLRSNRRQERAVA
jgi:hypothetical protein